MSIGEKIAAGVPTSVFEYIHEHPRVLTFATGALVVLSTALLISVTELDVLANQFRRARLGEIQRATSEALGG